MKILKKDAIKIHEELKKYEKSMGILAISNKLYKEAVLGQFYKTMESFSKLDDIESNFKEIYTNTLKLVIITNLYTNSYSYKDYKSSLEFADIKDYSELWAKKDKIELNEDDYRNLFFRNGYLSFYKDFEDFTNDIPFLATQILFYISKAISEKRVEGNENYKLKNALFIFTKKLLSFLVIKKFNLEDEIKEFNKRQAKREEEFNKRHNNQKSYEINENDIEWDII